MKNYGPITASISEFVVLLLGLTFAGHWLDVKTHHGSQYIFVGVLLGFGVGIWRLAKRLKKIVDDTDKEYEAEQRNQEKRDSPR